MNREIAADFCANATTLGHADLTNDNLTSLNFLAAKQLNAEALTWAIMNVFGCTAGFDVGHRCIPLLPCYYDEFSGDDLIFSVVEKLIIPNVLKTLSIIAHFAYLVNKG